MKIHPNADFPMLPDDELRELADTIKAHGLKHPIVLDEQDQILDGRARLKACELVGVDPEFEVYRGGDVDFYPFLVNAKRRNLTKGQLAMLAARASISSGNPERFPRETGTGFPEETSGRALGEQAGVSPSRVSLAFTVLRHAPDLVDSVISGAVSLNEAYKIAREQKAAADTAEGQLARLRVEDPELADQVVEGVLTLAGAWAERRARVEEDERQRRVATAFVCEVVVSLAQARGTGTFHKFDPDLVLPGRKITREVIDHAMEALTEMARVWRERDLP